MVGSEKRIGNLHGSRDGGFHCVSSASFYSRTNSRAHSGLYEYSCKNPYAELGRITVDHQTPENNRWRPYDSACAPPPFLATLRKALRTRSTGSDEPLPLTLPLPPRKAVTSSLPLPWLHGKTVLLFGDHVERNHNKDFCRLAGGQFETISRDHFLSPPRFVNGIDEKLQNANQENFDGSRPAVCYIPEYDFTIISVFHFGLANRVEFERESLLEDPAFYPPGTPFLLGQISVYH